MFSNVDRSLQVCQNPSVSVSFAQANSQVAEACAQIGQVRRCVLHCPLVDADCLLQTIQASSLSVPVVQVVTQIFKVFGQVRRIGGVNATACW